MSTDPNAADDSLADTRRITGEIQQFHEIERRRAAARAAMKPALFKALADADITLLTVYFDGEGDDGGIQEIDARAGDASAKLPNVTIDYLLPGPPGEPPCPHSYPLAEAVEEFVYDALSSTLSDGWMNNEGGFGDITFDVAAQTVTMDYHERYTETNDYHRDL